MTGQNANCHSSANTGCVQHVIGVVIETDAEMILNLSELQRNSSVVIKGEPNTIRTVADSDISLSVHKFISAEIPPQSALLQQSLCDSLVSWGANLDASKTERLKLRACASCKKPPPVINRPEPLNLQRDPVRVTSSRLLQHESYIKPDVYKFYGRLRFFRVNKLDTSDKHLILPFIPAAFPCNELVKALQPFCSKRTVVVMFSEDTKQPECYHAVFSFRSLKEAQEFSHCLHGQIISSGEESSSIVRYKLTPIPTRFLHAVPFVDKIEASGAMEIPTCPACLSVLDETVLNWPSTPAALEDNTKHCFGCPARISASYTQAHCSACEETDDLWLCMICGNVACSRYKSSHGINHCSHTGHSLTIKLSTFDGGNPFVWDYFTDRCVQRLSALPLDQEGKVRKQQRNEGAEREEDVQLAQFPAIEVDEQLSAATEEKKAISILELNAMYTSALDHTDQVHEVMARDLEQTYRAAEKALELEIEELRRRWEKAIGGKRGAAQKLARRKEFLKQKQKNLEEEQELRKYLEINLKERQIELNERRAELQRSRSELEKLQTETDQMMAQMGFL